MKTILFSFLNWWTWLLTFTSGFANVCTLTLFDTAVTHHTGNISRIPITSDPDTLLYLLGLVLSFFAGCVLCGVLFHEQILKPKKRYGILLIVLGGLLFLMSRTGNTILIIYTISFLSGAQNAMFLYVKTYLARTSHLTGYLTDTGFSLGRILAGYRTEWRKFLFNFSQIMFFVLGGYFAYVICARFPVYAVDTISLLYVIAGTIYFIVRSRQLFGFPSTDDSVKQP